MDLYQAMATYVRVVDTGSFSAAAKQLNVGQPTVSKTIVQLEGWLKVALLIRTTRRLTPTEAGHRFYERARTALQEMEEAVLAARGAGTGLAGCLRISAATTFARLHLIPLLPKFLAQHPGLDIDVVLDDRVIDHVAEGIDLSFRMGPLPELIGCRPQNCDRRTVRGRDACLFRPNGPPATPCRPRGTRGHHLCPASDHMVVRARWRSGVDHCQRSCQNERRRRCTCSGARGHGLHGRLDLDVLSELASGAVEQVLTDWCLRDVDVWAVFPVGRMPTAKARLFASFVESALG